jgi:competence protein ComGC
MKHFFVCAIYIKVIHGLSLIFIEMMIVLLVITVLLFIAIPNVAKQSKNINAKGCDAFGHMVAYKSRYYRSREGSGFKYISFKMLG